MDREQWKNTPPDTTITAVINVYHSIWHDQYDHQVEMTSTKHELEAWAESYCKQLEEEGYLFCHLEIDSVT